MSHYDFHLRTALATVNEAIALRDRALGVSTSALTLDETEILSRAIRHVLEPYIISAVRSNLVCDLTPHFLAVFSGL